MNIDTILETNFGPRAELFERLCTETRDLITKKIITILLEDRALTAPAFVQKHITVLGQEKLADVDRRTSLLFKNIIADVCLQMVEKQMLTGLLMLSASMNNPFIHSQFIQETALPYVQELVVTLDTQDPELLNEAVSGGIAFEQQEILRLFSMRFNDPDSPQ